MTVGRRLFLACVFSAGLALLSWIGCAVVPSVRTPPISGGPASFRVVEDVDAVLFAGETRSRFAHAVFVQVVARARVTDDWVVTSRETLGVTDRAAFPAWTDWSTEQGDDPIEMTYTRAFGWPAPFLVGTGHLRRYSVAYPGYWVISPPEVDHARAVPTRVIWGAAIVGLATHLGAWLLIVFGVVELSRWRVPGLTRRAPVV